jgi:hypothetical protein
MAEEAVSAAQVPVIVIIKTGGTLGTDILKAKKDSYGSL